MFGSGLNCFGFLLFLFVFDLLLIWFMVIVSDEWVFLEIELKDMVFVMKCLMMVLIGLILLRLIVVVLILFVFLILNRLWIV